MHTPITEFREVLPCYPFRQNSLALYGKFHPEFAEQHFIVGIVDQIIKRAWRE